MKKYWDRLEIGEKIPGLEKPSISRVKIAQFAAISNDFSPLHLDDDFAKSAGFSSAFAHGFIPLAILEESLQAFASNMKVVTLTGTALRLIRPNDRIFPRGLIIQHYQKNDEYRISFDLWCENQNNEVVMKGTALCLLFKNEQHEIASGLSIPAISQASLETFLKKYRSLSSLKKAVAEKDAVLTY